jgi:hypothetical protein
MSLASYHCSTPHKNYTRALSKGKAYRPGFSPPFLLLSRPNHHLPSFAGVAMIHPVVRSLVGVFAGVVVCGVLIGLT